MHVCKNYAKSKGIIILDTYIDRAMTGTNDNRPDLQRMLKDSKKREWKYVIVYKLDRFSRNKYEMAMHKKTLRDNGIKLVSATEYIPDTPETIIIESMLEGYAEYYSAELSQKVRRGMRESRIKGNYTCGTLLFGYEVVDHKLRIIEEETEIVRLIYSKYLNGEVLKDLINELNAQNITNNGRPFNKNTMYHILRNERYTGIVRYDGVIYDNIYPQIITPETFEKVRVKTLQNKHGGNSTITNYMLRKKVVCGYCGCNITAECGTARNGEVMRYYKCIGRKHGNGCRKASIHKAKLEEIVIKSLIDALNRPKVKADLVAKLMRYQKEQNEHSVRYEVLRREQRQVDIALQNLMKAVEGGLVTRTTGERLKELEQKQVELEEQVAKEKCKMMVEIPEETIAQFYEEALRMEPELLVAYLVNKIVLYDDKIQIYLNTPLMSSPEQDRGCFSYNCRKTYTLPYYGFVVHVTIYA
ncbi:MAG: recombinase family protein [Clostridia bacterium]|nr:recombinase family protein [Clostridia bacterium]